MSFFIIATFYSNYSILDIRKYNTNIIKRPIRLIIDVCYYSLTLIDIYMN